MFGNCNSEKKNIVSLLVNVFGWLKIDKID